MCGEKKPPFTHSYNGIWTALFWHNPMKIWPWCEWSSHLSRSDYAILSHLISSTQPEERKLIIWETAMQSATLTTVQSWCSSCSYMGFHSTTTSVKGAKHMLKATQRAMYTSPVPNQYNENQFKYSHCITHPVPCSRLILLMLRKNSENDFNVLCRFIEPF